MTVVWGTPASPSPRGRARRAAAGGPSLTARPASLHPRAPDGCGLCRSREQRGIAGGLGHRRRGAGRRAVAPGAEAAEAAVGGALAAEGEGAVGEPARAVAGYREEPAVEAVAAAAAAGVFGGSVGDAGGRLASEAAAAAAVIEEPGGWDAKASTAATAADEEAAAGTGPAR